MSLMANPTPWVTSPPTQNLGGLLNTAANYQYPLTSGLMSSLQPNQMQQGSLGTAPPGVPNYSAMALQMAGNPQAGPLAAVPLPSGLGIPGASIPSGGGSGALGGLMGVALQNPGMLKNLVQSGSGAVKGLLGPSLTSADASLAATPASIAAGEGGMLGNGALDASIQAGAGVSPSVEAALGGAADAAAPAVADAAAPAAADAAVAGGDASSAGLMGSLGMGAGALAGLYGLDMLFNKQSQVTPGGVQQSLLQNLGGIKDPAVAQAVAQMANDYGQYGFSQSNPLISMMNNGGTQWASPTRNRYTQQA